MTGIRPTFLALLVAALFATGVVQAQTRTYRLPVDDGEVVADVDIRRTAGEVGGYGWIDVRLSNGTSREQRVALEIRNTWGPQLSIPRAMSLERGEERRVILPLPQIEGSTRLEIDVAGSRNVSQSVESQGGSEPSVAVIGAVASRAVGWRAALAGALRAEPEPFEALRPEDLPDRWWLLSGFALVVVDGGAAGLDAERQDLLAHYLRAGGRLLVVRADGLGDGPLRELIATPADAAGSFRTVGFGHLVALSAADSADLPGAFPMVMEEHRAVAMLIGDLALDRSSPDPSRTMVTPTLRAPMRIPGIGEVPLALFSVLLVLFAILVGPVNVFWCQRKRRRELLLITIPVLGLGVATIVLVYGLFAEGFGVRGARRTVTVLDQRAKTAVAWSHQTLYASVGTGRLTPRSDTLLEGPAWFGWTVPGFALTIDDQGRFGAGIVPARTSAPLTSVAFGDGRARLRFARRDDGGLDVLAGGGVDPLADDSVVVFLPDGDTFRGGGARVEPCDRRVALERVQALLGTLQDPAFTLDSSEWRGRPVAPGMVVMTLPHSHETEEQAPAAPAWPELIREIRSVGGYVARVREPVAVDTFGLDVEEVAGSHLVFGLLAPEDVVDG